MLLRAARSTLGRYICIVSFCPIRITTAPLAVIQSEQITVLRRVFVWHKTVAQEEKK